MESRIFQRFEAKYLVPETRAFAIAAFIQPFVRPDLHAREGAGYQVDSIYWDAPHLHLYRSSVCGEKNRFKLRVRSYGPNGNGHVLLEIKRRMDQVICKERVWMETSEAENLMRVPSVFTQDAAPMNSCDVMVLHRFRGFAENLSAVPIVNVSYAREAYVGGGEDSAIRITFDRNVVCVPTSNYAHSTIRTEVAPFPVITSGVVLEIKFTNRFPSWVKRTIERFDLQRQSVSKYVLAVNALKRQGIKVGCHRGVTVR